MNVYDKYFLKLFKEAKFGYFNYGLENMGYNISIKSTIYFPNMETALKPKIPWFFNTTAGWRIFG